MPAVTFALPLQQGRRASPLCTPSISRFKDRQPRAATFPWNHHQQHAVRRRAKRMTMLWNRSKVQVTRSGWTRAEAIGANYPSAAPTSVSPSPGRHILSLLTACTLALPAALPLVLPSPFSLSASLPTPEYGHHTNLCEVDATRRYQISRAASSSNANRLQCILHPAMLR
ncbi:hypothetical protein CKAH01_09891 [Colletotrichum kahawae]|uniref:Uncharacterized protein n=1 Tax=Colletotrichum kahawae TaxID=34407 RepID=A0AAD9Y007_COLKA|nr:hypothetical protein CKAH01_09891 [Colletotrichum kahawae]